MTDCRHECSGVSEVILTRLKLNSTCACRLKISCYLLGDVRTWIALCKWQMNIVLSKLVLKGLLDRPILCILLKVIQIKWDFRVRAHSNCWNRRSNTFTKRCTSPPYVSFFNLCSFFSFYSYLLKIAGKVLIVHTKYCIAKITALL